LAGETFDVTIIGAGPGGYVAAVRAAQLGLKTAIVEKEKGGRLGGTCGLRGCIPTKQLLMSAHLYEQTQHLKEFGINVDGVSFDFAGVQKRKGDIVKKNSDGVSYLMKKNKVTVFNGFGKLAGAGKVEVTKEDGKKETIETKNIIIATGSVVKPFPGFEADGAKIVNSDQILELQKVPKSMIVMGAGAVGVEFASVYSRFGCDTTIVEFMPRLLPVEDEEVSKELERNFKKRGFKLQLGTKLEKLEKTKTGVKVTGVDANGKPIVLEAEMFLVAVGRMPYLEGLGLEGTKVEIDKRGTVVVDNFCRTGEPGVYAIGDAIATPWLAHLASKEGIIVVEQIAGQKAEPINMRLVPNCTYCDPEVASVGLTEKKAREEGYDVKIGKFPFSASGKARILGETEGFVKIIGDAKTDKILGVHILAAHASDMIGECVVAVEFAASCEDLARTFHAHPTLPEAIKEAAMNVDKHAIHI
jgi:dihydrolipoamide dehydrogenase